MAQNLARSSSGMPGSSAKREHAIVEVEPAQLTVELPVLAERRRSPSQCRHVGHPRASGARRRRSLGAVGEPSSHSSEMYSRSASRLMRSLLRRNCGSSRGSSTRRARARARNSSSTLSVAPVAVDLPVRRHRPEVDDPGVRSRRNFLRRHRTWCASVPVAVPSAVSRVTSGCDVQTRTFRHMSRNRWTFLYSCVTLRAPSGNRIGCIGTSNGYSRITKCVRVPDEFGTVHHRTERADDIARPGARPHDPSAEHRQHDCAHSGSRLDHRMDGRSACAGCTRRRRSSRATASASTRPARSAPAARSATMSRARPRAPHRTRCVGRLQRARTAPHPEAPPRSRPLNQIARSLTERRRPTARRWRAVGRSAPASAARPPRHRACCTGCAAASSSFMPSASPSLNSFWALPRFLASFGSCEPPNTSNTMTRTMISSWIRNLACGAA